MKRTNVYLEEEQSRLLRHLAVEENRSFTDLVREALSEYLVRRGVSRYGRIVHEPPTGEAGEKARREFMTSLETIWANLPDDMSPEEIEHEITLARQEVKEERAKRRLAAGG